MRGFKNFFGGCGGDPASQGRLFANSVDGWKHPRNKKIGQNKRPQQDKTSQSDFYHRAVNLSGKTSFPFLIFKKISHYPVLGSPEKSYPYSPQKPASGRGG